MPLRIVIREPIRCSCCGLSLSEREMQYCHEDEFGRLTGEHAECAAKRIVEEAFASVKLNLKG